MAREHGADAIYKVADLFRDRCLTEGASLLWPMHRPWTPSNISLLWDAFIGNPDEGEETFFEKWQRQLETQSEDVHRIASDTLAIYYLFPSNINKETKLKNVNMVIDWRLKDQQPEIQAVEHAYSSAIGNGGMLYSTKMPWQIAFFLQFARGILSEHINPRSAHECMSLADRVAKQVHASQAARNVILHLLFPDDFERIASDGHKRMIYTTFQEFAGNAEDVDDALLNIRKALETRSSREIDFYSKDLKRQWLHPQRKPEEPDAAAWIFQANPTMYDIRGAIKELPEQTWLVKQYKDRVKPKNTAYMWESGATGGIVGVAEVLDLPSVRPHPEIETKFMKQLEKFRGARLRVKLKILRAIDPPLSRHVIGSHPELQSLSILRQPQGTNYPVTEKEASVLDELLSHSRPKGNELELELAAYTKIEALRSLFISERRFEQMLRALHQKKNVLLQGPPGVGKTFVAKRLAYALVGRKDPTRVQMIQFHQSYSYEDFIQGFRPTDKGFFELRSGVFYEFCLRAQRDPDRRPFVFIIDEINRGNLSKIFGELMMLIEPDKRGTEYSIPLAYSKNTSEQFFIPENLYLIGTMNTADRSLAMVDYALRRRFRFITLKPEFESMSFHQHLEDQGVEVGLIQKIIDRMTDVNERIASDRRNLGNGYQVGHSYFCPPANTTPDEEWYRSVIEEEILPLLQEYWFDDEDRVASLAELLLG